MSRKYWNAGDQLNAADLNGNFFAGGTGADGALSVSSGTTTLNCSGANTFLKNHSSIAITGTGALAFSSTSSNGTIVILKSAGGATLTSSAAALINGNGNGAASPGNNGIGSAYALPGGGSGVAGVPGTGGAAGTAGSAALFLAPSRIVGKAVPLFCGAAGGNGGNSSSAAAGGAGGAGGLALLIECAGALNFTGAIQCNGTAGSNGVANGGGGGGGGGGGSVVILYGALTANSGTISVSGGSAGSGNASGGYGGGGGAGGAGALGAGSVGSGGTNAAGGNGGAGGNGWSLVTQNIDFS